MRTFLPTGIVVILLTQAGGYGVSAVQQMQENQEVIEAEPFSTETVEELARYRAVLETSVGPITIELLPEKAPNHVRNFLRLAVAGVYDGTAWHRVIPGFLIQTGLVSTRSEPLSEESRKYIRT